VSEDGGPRGRKKDGDLFEGNGSCGDIEAVVNYTKLMRGEAHVLEKPLQMEGDAHRPDPTADQNDLRGIGRIRFGSFGNRSRFCSQDLGQRRSKVERTTKGITFIVHGREQ
jgi:hypothetical protein